MKKKTKDISRLWTRTSLFAVALILIGIFVAIATFLTVIGPILGLILAGFGVYLFFRASQKATHEVESDKPARPTKPRSEAHGKS